MAGKVNGLSSQSPDHSDIFFIYPCMLSLVHPCICLFVTVHQATHKVTFNNKDVGILNDCISFPVVNHHGARAIGGHYTTYVYHNGIHGWVHLDDSVVKTVPLSQVLKIEHPRVPYLLYYRRLDYTTS